MGRASRGIPRTAKDGVHRSRPGGIGGPLAETVKFELTDSYPPPVFKTGALNRSATFPDGAGEGSRTLVISLEGCGTAAVLYSSSRSIVSVTAGPLDQIF